MNVPGGECDRSADASSALAEQRPIAWLAGLLLAGLVLLFAGILVPVDADGAFYGTISKNILRSGGG